MNAYLGRAPIALAVVALAAALTACGTTEEGGSGSSDAVRIGLLLPENETARYEKFDKPLMEKKVALLTLGKGKVLYANAAGDAARQNTQAEAMIKDKVDVLVIDAVDSKAIAGAVTKAKEAGIAVVAYDRLAEGPIDAYTSFDNEDIGRAPGQGDAGGPGRQGQDREDRHDERRGQPTPTPPASRPAPAPCSTARSTSARSTTPSSGSRRTPTPT